MAAVLTVSRSEVESMRAQVRAGLGVAGLTWVDHAEAGEWLRKADAFFADESAAVSVNTTEEALGSHGLWVALVAAKGNAIAARMRAA